MSYTLTPIAVDLARVTAAVGSGDKRLLAALTRKYAEEFEEIDGLGDDFEDDAPGKVELEPPENIENLEQFTSAIRDGFERMLRGEELDQDHLMSRFIAAADAEPTEGDQDESEERPIPSTSTREVMRHLIMGEEYDRSVGFKYGYALEMLCRRFGKLLPNEHWNSLRHGSMWFREIDAALQSLGIPESKFRVVRHLAERGSPIPIPEIDDFPAIGYLKLDEIREARKALGGVQLDAIEDEFLRESLVELRSWFQACIDSKRDLICFYS